MIGARSSLGWSRIAQRFSVGYSRILENQVGHQRKDEMETGIMQGFREAQGQGSPLEAVGVSKI